MLAEKRIPFLYIVKSVKFDVLVVLVFTTIIIYLKQHFHIPFDLDTSIPAFLGTAITLVLAFKLNQSYDRWWEARKIWGSIVNDSRSLSIQLINFTKDKSRKEINDSIYRQIAWCYGLDNLLRETGDFSKLEKFISKSEFEELAKSANVPLYLSNQISDAIRNLHQDGEINDYQQMQIDSTIVRLVASMGKAERIKNTVFPRTYRVFLRFFVYIFLLTLAVSLSDLHPAFEIPLLVTISLPFFLLKKTSVHIQDPFENFHTDTAMTSISETIETNLKELIKDDSKVERNSDFGYYVM